MSQLTIRRSFFDNLWPLILSDNVCDIRTKHACSFYDPDQLFDNIWLHAYLARRGFKNYQPPTVLRCRFDDKEEELLLSESTADKDSDTKIAKPCEKLKDDQPIQSDEEEELYKPTKVDVAALEQQSAAVHSDFDQRRKLAHAFINRQYPWYMQRPVYDAPIEFIHNVRQEFYSKLEQAVIEDIYTYNCKLMIIDLLENVCLHVMQQWLKFTRYAFVIVIVRSESAMKKIKLMGSNLEAVVVVENMEYTWQEQLTESLRIAVAHAIGLGEFDNCMKSFVFVFSRNRNSTKLDMHKVIRKNI